MVSLRSLLYHHLRNPTPITYFFRYNSMNQIKLLHTYTQVHQLLSATLQPTCSVAGITITAPLGAGI
jgi:hypothetical protein